MTNQCQLAGQTFTLDRYPPEQKNRSLQAWDSADELLLSHALPILQQAEQLPGTPSVLLLNDQFGALACALVAYQPVQVSDSYISELATRHNFNQNQLELSNLTQLNSLSSLPAAPLVLLKLPNNHSYLRYQLRQLKQQLPASTTILASAKAKDITPNLLAIFQQELGPTSASLTVKKCRLITTTIDPALAIPSVPAFPIRWNSPDDQQLMVNHANVFSREQLDQGARFLLEHIPVCAPEQRVIDLGCGNGVLGLAMLQRQPQIRLVFADESYMAVDSARLTLNANRPDLLPQAEFSVDDCLSQQAAESADFIICNPPFHQQNAITDHIAWQMFTDARRVLKKHGRLRIVANRHLAYSEKLARLFGGCIHVASNAKFTILEAIKRN
ncbi:MAG: methyltransferase [Gammaproteobacteria bacterium]|nr:methyltransferase [Gammaproteobacteria bacterium]MBU2427937.1 methyltransferase [Gammaproteobacteria bacterium]